MAPRRPETLRCSEDRLLNQADQSPNIVDRPVRSARTFVVRADISLTHFSGNKKKSAVQDTASEPASSIVHCESKNLRAPSFIWFSIEILSSTLILPTSQLHAWLHGMHYVMHKIFN